jgi:hypothetical protein
MWLLTVSCHIAFPYPQISDSESKGFPRRNTLAYCARLSALEKKILALMLSDFPRGQKTVMINLGKICCIGGIAQDGGLPPTKRFFDKKVICIKDLNIS